MSLECWNWEALIDTQKYLGSDFTWISWDLTVVRLVHN